MQYSHGEVYKELKFCRGCVMRETALRIWRRNVRWVSFGRIDGEIVYICQACAVTKLYSITKAERVKNKEHLAKLSALQKKLYVYGLRKRCT